MIKEPEDEAFEEIEKTQQRRGISLNTVRHPRGAPAPKEGLNPDSLETVEIDVPWATLIRGVRVEGDTVVITVKGGNEAARALCGALIEEMNRE